jgi:hypothetical protein
MIGADAIKVLFYCLVSIWGYAITKKVENRWLTSGEGSSAQNSSARKNCSTPKSRLLNTVRADDKNICISSKIKKVCRTCLVEQMHFLDKNYQLLELQLLDKNIEKCQLLKLKKVESLGHVRQFG